MFKAPAGIFFVLLVKFRHAAPPLFALSILDNGVHRGASDRLARGLAPVDALILHHPNSATLDFMR